MSVAHNRLKASGNQSRNLGIRSVLPSKEFERDLRRVTTARWCPEAGNASVINQTRKNVQPVQQSTAMRSTALEYASFILTRGAIINS
jgi:hypothetical protein